MDYLSPCQCKQGEKATTSRQKEPMTIHKWNVRNNWVKRLIPSPMDNFFMLRKILLIPQTIELYSLKSTSITKYSVIKNIYCNIVFSIVLHNILQTYSNFKNSTCMMFPGIITVYFIKLTTAIIKKNLYHSIFLVAIVKF